MKKYKLIKRYPGSPRLHTIIHKGGNVSSNATSTYFFMRGAGINLADSSIENNSEFWEEVIEKEYEILTIVCKWSSPRRSPGDIIKNQPGNGCESYNEHCHLIHSVKRLSDGEIFTVGDRVKDNKDICYFTIKQFNLIDGCCAGEININYLSKCLKPLFTTEDGVDIFEGDKTCWLNNWHITNFVDWQRIKNTQEIHFSTVEAAEEHILMNKPCISLNDIFGNSNLEEDSVIWYGLRDLVKKKCQ